MKNIDYGGRIKQRRKELGITQKELAIKLKVTISLISKYESNKAVIPSDKLKDMAIFLNISTDYLLGIKRQKILKQ